MNRRWALLPVLLIACCALIWRRADAAEPVGEAVIELVSATQIDPNEPEYSGVFACLGCHSAGAQSPYGDSLNRVRLDEVLVWHRQDKHSLAYCVLQGELAKTMSARLGYNVAEAKQCLACHAPRHEDRSDDPNTAPNYKLAEGVTCEDCHGGSRGWHRLHVLKDRWRGLTADEKQAHGMNDLRDPATRAKVCLDCHVGNADQQQIVTHAMYAAGHPPLASVDVVAYAEQMPRHWLTDSERAERGAPRENVDPFLATRQAVIGNLVSGERAMSLAAHGLEGPDFAVFDCDACHHELSSPSWRQARHRSGIPGRPQLREWSLRAGMGASLLVGSDLDDGVSKDLVTRVQALLQPQAFGRHDELGANVETLTELARHWQVQTKKSSGRLLSKSDAEQLVKIVLEQSLDAERPPDYDTARVMTWLLRTAWIDLHTFDPQANAPAREAWQALEEQLGLTVPTRTDVTPPGAAVSIACPITPPQPIADALKETLRPRAEYDPKKFQDALRTFAEAVSSSVD